MLGSTQVTIRSDGKPAVMQVAAAVRDAKRAEMDWPREQRSWWVAWSGHSKMNLRTTARCKHHWNQRPLLGFFGTRHVAEPGEGWVR